MLIKNKRVEIKNEYEKFRNDNKIERSSILPRSGALATGIIIFILIIETMLNGYFFGKGNPLGLVGLVFGIYFIFNKYHNWNKRWKIYFTL